MFKYQKSVFSNNNNLNITGILMYSDGSFFQVLEGQKEQIQSLFQKIQNDSRHYYVIKIFDRKITNASFSEYYASFKVLGDRLDHGELQCYLDQEKHRNPDIF